MTSLQIALRKIKDLKTIISNLNVKYGDGYEQLEHTVIILQKEVMRLTTKNEQLKNENEKITDQLEALLNKIKKTSETSDAPSSANIFKKPISTRVKSGRKSGGQPGHKGYTLNPFPDAEIIYCLPIKKCVWWNCSYLWWS